MDEAERLTTIGELKSFYKRIRSYENRQRRRNKDGFSEAQDRSLNALRLELQRERGRLGDIISEYGGNVYLPYLGIDYEVFALALSSLEMTHNQFTALDGATSIVNKAIGKLESGVRKADVGNDQGSIVAELEVFRNELAAYQYLQQRKVKGEQISVDELRSITQLRSTLLKKSGRFRSCVTDQAGRQDMVVVGEDGKENLQDIWFAGLKLEFDSLASEALDSCMDATKMTIGELEDDIKKGYRDEQGNPIGESQKIHTEPPKAFIAHEGITRALDKVKSFLDALGVKYLIAEIEPSDGRVVEEQVEWTKEQADFAIILATKGKLINKETGKPQMGTNVADELGRARHVFQNRIILLLETGLEAHTNIGGIVRARFMPQSMDKAFIKIVGELRNWGFLIAVKAKEQP